MNTYTTRADVVATVKSTMQEISEEANEARAKMQAETNIANRSFFQGLALGLETAKLRIQKALLMIEA